MGTHRRPPAPAAPPGGAREAGPDARRRPRPRRRPGAGHRLGGARGPRPRRRACGGTTSGPRCGATGRSSRPGRCAARSTWWPPTSCRSSSRALGTRINWLRPLWLRYFEVTTRGDARPPGRDRRGAEDRPMTRAALGEALAKHARQRGVRRPRDEQLGHVPQARREPRPPVLRPGRRPQRHLRRPAASGSGARCRSPPRTRSRRSSSASSTRSPAAPRASSRAGGACRAAPPSASRSPRSATASPSCPRTGRRCSCSPRTSRRSRRSSPRPPSASCPPSTRTRWACRRRPSRSCRIARRPLVSRTAGWISQVLLVGGAIQGTWTHEVKKGRLEIRLVPWRRLTKAERQAIDAEAARIGAFLGAEPDAGGRPTRPSRRRPRSARTPGRPAPRAPSRAPRRAP